MTEKKRSGLFIIIKNLLQAHAKRLSDLGYLISLETRLAGKTIITMLFLTLLLLFLVGSTWLSTLFLVFFIMVAFNFSHIFAASVIILLNIFLILIVVIYIRAIKKYISFPATRRQFNNMVVMNKDRYE